MTRPTLTTLPKWAQRLIAEQLAELDSLRSVAAILCDKRRMWFTIPGPRMADNEDYRYLWVLDREKPFPICSIGRGDTLIIGRAK